VPSCAQLTARLIRPERLQHIFLWMNCYTGQLDIRPKALRKDGEHGNLLKPCSVGPAKKSQCNPPTTRLQHTVACSRGKTTESAASRTFLGVPGCSHHVITMLPSVLSTGKAAVQSRCSLRAAAPHQSCVIRSCRDLSVRVNKAPEQYRCRHTAASTSSEG
jgi:hypothetical protein